MQTGYAEDDLADGRAALLSGWRIGLTLYGSLAVVALLACGQRFE
jgi:hypothetical protein